MRPDVWDEAIMGPIRKAMVRKFDNEIMGLDAEEPLTARGVTGSKIVVGLALRGRLRKSSDREAKPCQG